MPKPNLPNYFCVLAGAATQLNQVLEGDPKRIDDTLSVTTALGYLTGIAAAGQALFPQEHSGAWAKIWRYDNSRIETPTTTPGDTPDAPVPMPPSSQPSWAEGPERGSEGQ